MSDRGTGSTAGRQADKGLLLKNGTVLDYFPVALDAEPDPKVEKVDLRLAGERVVERGPDLTPRDGEEVIDLKGATLMPGNINAHGHLYSALAAGMPQPKTKLETFTDILTEIWWPLDRALDAEAVYLSALAGSWDAVRCGTTLIFDHHASLASVGGSLDRVEQGLAEVGLRGCLCYEVTDRGGKGQRDITLEENERYLSKLADAPPQDIPPFPRPGRRPRQLHSRGPHPGEAGQDLRPLQRRPAHPSGRGHDRPPGEPGPRLAGSAGTARGPRPGPARQHFRPRRGPVADRHADPRA